MPSITIELSAEVEAAAREAAAKASSSLEEYVAQLVGRAVAPPPTLSWKGKEVLKVLRGARARPGGDVPVQALNTLWWQTNASAGGEALWEGCDELVAAGFIEPIEGESTGVTLTEAGYEAAQRA